MNDDGIKNILINNNFEYVEIGDYNKPAYIYTYDDGESIRITSYGNQYEGTYWRCNYCDSDGFVNSSIYADSLYELLKKLEIL